MAGSTRHRTCGGITMTIPKVKPTAATVGQEPARQCKLASNDSKPPKKIHRILAAFANGESLNFIEAQQRYHDRSLHSTVSEIQRDYSIMVSRKPETISGYMGCPTHCRRYWMEPDQKAKALEILGGAE